ncbi:MULTISPECIES: PaaI family thioesterase [Desulfofundulus]|uniref:Acyl-coenzyme A thioesterase THEM4 n=1 Tax=Desulfofundulus australicus DSM 11792 TaxID=1121425 RepID=A0A1M4S911_9FIRM|nr:MULTISPECIES: hotdog domain-containing protein [Desulfofundulus]MCS5696517.1 PaaI family thioesterase [Desulfofundulus thermocisternus]SHE28696.1 Acyl-coenzyme A thioesterase PaaI, contains HGG motif [Desulfofundulus australicus DSM 11792]
MFRRSDGMCFACSPRNPIGLHLEFSHEGDICRTTFTAGNEHQGWDGVLHGGLVTTLLDEAMAQWLWHRGVAAMTAEMLTRFSLPVPVGVPVTVEAWKEGCRGRLWELSARLILPGGKVAARATAKFLTVKENG